MITAKNYVAQVVKTLRKIHEMRKGKPQWERDELSFRSLIPTLIEAQHFVLPDDGKLFDDGFKGLLDKKLRLPFPSITVEYLCPVKGASTVAKVVALATQEGREEAPIRVTGFVNIDGGWRFGPFSVNLHSDWTDSEGRVPLTKLFFNRDNSFLVEGFELNFPDWVRYVKEKHGIDADQDDREVVMCMVPPIFELLEALSCRNVTTATYQKEATNNQQKIKKGKLPVYETKVLVIDPVGKRYNKTDGTGPTHSSPRQHLRRGHIRRLRSGNIWVNSCVVGSSEKGKIDKIYALRR
jgi:hypothetical protein